MPDVVGTTNASCLDERIDRQIMLVRQDEDLVSSLEVESLDAHKQSVVSQRENVEVELSSSGNGDLRKGQRP